MKKQNRKAFTIVELVIVIAVIAILAAVLIPTFSGVIKNANISSDQATAATLTTELRVSQVGSNITNEAELMAAIQKIDPDGTKLVPKALNYGYHFWFDMTTQTIVAATAEEIDAIESTKVPDNNDVESVAFTDDLVANNVVSFRDVFDNGYYLIDSPKTLNIVFGDIDTMKNAADYQNVIENFTERSEDKIYGTLATAVLDKLQTTTIRNEYGIFHYAGNTNNFEYFANDVQVLVSNRYVYDNGVAREATADDAVPTPRNGIVYLPSSVLLVQEGALNYANKNSVTVMTSLSTVSEIVGVFAPGSTNALIKDAEKTKTYIVTVGPKGGVPGNPDAPVLHQYFSDTDTAWVADLVIKTTLVDWSLDYSLTDETQKANKESWLKLNGTTLYVAYAADVDFYIRDNTGKKSNAVQNWEYTDETVAKVVDGKLELYKGGETTITATVINLYGEETTESINIVVNEPQSAVVTIDGNNYDLLPSGGTYNIEWYFNGNNDLPATFFKGDDGTGTGIDFNTDYALGSQKLTVEIVETAEGESMFQLNTAKTGVAMKTDGNGNVVGVGETTFKLSIDGCLETTFTVTVINNSASPLEVGFHDKSESDVYKYYIGDNNGVKLGDLFDLKTGKSLTNATLTVYDYKMSYNDYWEANETDQYVTVSLNGESKSSWTLDSNWATQVLDFSDVTEATTVWIKIAPENDSAIFIEFTVVDATNYAKLTDIPADANGKIILETNVVLYDDCEINTGTTVEVGTGKTLYGNGYKINATTFVASDKLGSGTMTTQKYKESVCDYHSKITFPQNLTKNCLLDSGNCQKRSVYSSTTSNCDYYATDAYMIKLDGGKIDNIYINGPVFPDLQYYESVNTLNGNPVANTPYYVSGIKAGAGSEILNSYVFGFRQAVEVNAASGSVSFDNCTIEGGNFANIDWVDGDMSLNDVTTVQKSTGYETTIGTSKNIIGMGVAIGDLARDNKVTITGYLNQYNWVSKESGTMLPIIDGIKLSEIFNYIFDGIMGRKMGSVYFYVHQSTDGKEYVNAAFVFIQVGNQEQISGYSDSGTLSNNMFDQSEREGHPDLIERTLSKGELAKFSNIGVEALNLTAEAIVKKDGKMAIISYKDGRNWTVEGSGLTSKLVEITTEEERQNVVILGNDGYEIDYSGYYTNYGK